MSKIVVMGGGVVGLSAAMLLSRQGHDVTVFERDPEPVPGSPDEAWRAWDRRGVAQFRQAHYLHTAARHILDVHLPEVSDSLLKAGCIEFDFCSEMSGATGVASSREAEERFVTITGRRPAIEYAFASTAERFIPVVRGVSVVELLVGPSASPGIPHVAGIRTSDGQAIATDLVIDATGRRSKLPEMLEAIGARRPVEEADESSFIYYTRFFRSASGKAPACRAMLLTHFHSFSLLTLPGDSGTWSVTVFTFAGDPPMKALRHTERWKALVSACPLQAHWLDGEPITDVTAMGGTANRYRRFVVEGTPVATGILAVGDSWGCTNPVGGRGITMGLKHALGTAEVVRQHAGDPLPLALAHDDMTEAIVAPWYHFTADFDRRWAARIAATVEGRPEPQSANVGDALFTASMYDADLFRAFAEVFEMLALPREVVSRPGLVERTMAVASAHASDAPVGPSRDEMLRMLA